MAKVKTTEKVWPYRNNERNEAGESEVVQLKMISMLTLLKKEKKSLLLDAIAVSLVGVISFIFSLQASNDIWRTGNTGVDSSVFKYVARVILSGGMPYKDAFDHKGPLIYLINVFGMKIATWRGVWVFEFLAILITFYFMYKIARLYVGCGISILILLIASSPLFSYLEGGNLTEEYAMPFIAVSIYIFLDYFVMSHINPFRLAICGSSFGAILLLRPNMCAVWLVMCLGVLIECIWKKELKKLGPFISWFVVGMLILLVPVILWLIVNGAFKAFVEDYILFNMQYSSDGGQALLANRVNSVVHFLNSGLILFCMSSISYVCYRKKHCFDILYLVYLGVTLLLICLPGRIYGHYGMVLVPALSYPLARMVSVLKEDLPNRIVSDLFVIYLLVAFAASGWLGGVANVAVEYCGKDKLYFGTGEQEVVNLVVKHSNEDEKIIVLGNWDIIYNLSGRFAASRYSYQVPPLNIDRNRAEEFYKEIQQNKPKVIVLPQNKFAYDWTLKYVEENGYYEIGKTTDKTVTVYSRSN